VGAENVIRDLEQVFRGTARYEKLGQALSFPLHLGWLVGWLVGWWARGSEVGYRQNPSIQGRRAGLRIHFPRYCSRFPTLLLSQLRGQKPC
jgi:hypothetical protein